MSNEDASRSSPHDNEPRQHSLVADVTFTTVAPKDAKNRSDDSRGESIRQDKDKWSMRGERFKDRLLTPPRSLSSRKSEETQWDIGSNDGSVQKRAGGVRGSLLEYSTSRNPKSAGKRRAETTSSPYPDAAVPGSGGAAFDRKSRPEASSSQPVARSQVLPRTRDHNVTSSRSMDPAQLVQMALVLSESRKRHASTPVGLAVASTSATLRPVSAGFAAPPKAISSDNSSHELLNSQVVGAHDSTLRPNDVTHDNTGDYHFSPATLVRAEKARKHFELADKHRRLLLQLPRLPPSRDHKARSRAFSRASHHGSHDQKQYGREYNPLQALRNRRVREQQKDAAEYSAEQFLDLDRVEQWLNEVESATSEHSTEHPVQLPVFSPGNEYSSGTGGGHRRAGTADTVITKPNYDWDISPAELLADTYWTEQGHNQTTVDIDRKHKGLHSHDRRPNADRSDHDHPGSQPQDVTSEKSSHGHRRLIPLSAGSRLRQHRFTRLNRSPSVSSTSSAEGHKRLPIDTGIGPLQRHMEEMIRKDAHDELSSPSTKSPDHWDSLHIRHRSIDRHQEPMFVHQQSPKGHTAKSRSEKDVTDIMKQPALSSSEASYPTSPVDRLPALIEHNVHGKRTSASADNQKSNVPPSRLGSRDRGTSSTLDSAQQDESSSHYQDDGIDRSRLSVEASRPETFRRHKTTDSGSSYIRDSVHVRSKPDSSESTTKEPSSAVTRFLRGGRLADMVRSESSRFGSRLRGSERPGDEPTSDISAINSEASDAEGMVVQSLKGTVSADISDASPRASLDKIRKRPRYHIPHLPSFRSSQTPDAPSLNNSQSYDSADHISRQQALLRKRNHSPRFERLAPPRINLPEGDDDPKHLAVPADGSSASEERRKSYGLFNSALRNRSRSRSKPRALPSDRGRTGGQQISEASSTRPTRSTGDSRHWSISDQRSSVKPTDKIHTVTSQDVARIQALLLASGIKAREISRRLEVPATKLPRYLLESAQVCGMHESALQHRPGREEHTYAVQILSSFVDETFSSLGKEIEVFQTKDSQALISRQDQLKARVSEDLTEMVHGASDQADAFNIELSTQATLRTKQIDDAVDAVLRLRRRQFRLLRLIAFKVLEWVTLSLLWWVWFVVVCFKTTQRIVFGIFRLLRWLFTL